MSGIKATCVVACHEIDGREPAVPVGKTGPTIEVASHWSKREMVTLRAGETTYTVVGAELREAIVNALNRGPR